MEDKTVPKKTLTNPGGTNFEGFKDFENKIQTKKKDLPLSGILPQGFIKGLGRHIKKYEKIIENRKSKLSNKNDQKIAEGDVVEPVTAKEKDL